MNPVWVYLLLLLLAPAVSAHEVRPAYLQMTETQPERFAVVWKVPRRGDLALGLHVQWPAACRDVAPVTRRALGDAVVEQRVLTCATGRLVGESIAIDGLIVTMTDVLVRIVFLDGRVQTNVIKPNTPSFVVQGRQPWTRVAYEYALHGVQHILFGVDHLLFVFGLLLIVSERCMLLKTITAFTAAHSLTLATATLAYANVPAAPLNAAIALSILFLGPEIVRTWRGETSLTIRQPWLVAFVFGLLHGFGFAGALMGAGLARADLLLALLTFNIGVEIGQVAFVILMLLLERSFRQLEMCWPRWVTRAPGYVVGSLGAFWTMQRTATMIGLIQ
jgi:hypothetical protein